MQTSDGRMSVDTGCCAVPSKKAEKSVDVIPQPFRRDGCVFHEGYRLGFLPSWPWTGPGRLPANSRHVPGREVESTVKVVSQAAIPQIVFQRLKASAEVLGRVVVELDTQQSSGIAFNETSADSLQRRALFRVAEDEGIHHLDC